MCVELIIDVCARYLLQGVSMLSENQQILTRNCGQNQPKFEVHINTQSQQILCT